MTDNDIYVFGGFLCFCAALVGKFGVQRRLRAPILERLKRDHGETWTRLGFDETPLAFENFISAGGFDELADDELIRQCKEYRSFSIGTTVMLLALVLVGYHYAHWWWVEIGQVVAMHPEDLYKCRE